MVKKIGLILISLFLISGVLALESIATEITIKTEPNSKVEIKLKNPDSYYPPLIINEDAGSDGIVTYSYRTLVYTFEMNVEVTKGNNVIGTESGLYTAGIPIELEIFEPEPEINETENEETTTENENPASNVSISGFFVEFKDGVDGVFSSKASYYSFGTLFLAGLIILLIAKIRERGGFKFPSLPKVGNISESSLRKELSRAERKLTEAQKELRAIKNQERIKEAEERVREEQEKLEKLKRGED
jgi:hypothetical protein